MRDEQIIEGAQSIFNRTFARHEGRGMCLYWTLCVLMASEELGRRLIVQAGSAMWRRVSEEDDNGEEPLFFGYQWGGPGTPAPHACLAAGILPEMHIWAADPQTEEIIDLTTAWQATRCEDLSGYPFLTPELPAVFWGGSDAVEEIGWYQVDRFATELAGTLMQVEAMKHGVYLVN